VCVCVRVRERVCVRACMCACELIGIPVLNLPLMCYLDLLEPHIIVACIHISTWNWNLQQV